MSVLKENGLRHFWSQILAKLNEKVDKIGGKDLSTNDFTNEYKTKLDSIESGAQVNTQADWQQNDETAKDYVKNRPGGYEGSPENVLSETTFSGTSATLDMALVLGYTYIVTFDGIEYVSTAKRDGAYPIFIGNTTYAWHGTITDDPFCILGNTNPCTINCDPGDHTVKVDKINIVKIPEKYLDIKNTNIVNGSAKGSLRTIGSKKEDSGYEIGQYAFAEGYNTSASGSASHAEGYYTTASSNYQHVQGKYNIADTTTYADIIGNGSSDTERSNAATVDWNGNGWYAGDVYVGSTSGKNKDEGSKKLATEEYIDTQIGDINTALDSIIEMQNSLIGGN